MRATSGRSAAVALRDLGAWIPSAMARAICGYTALEASLRHRTSSKAVRHSDLSITLRLLKQASGRSPGSRRGGLAGSGGRSMVADDLQLQAAPRVLHIAPHKPGTTMIQDALHLARERLAAQGVV